MNVIWIDSVGSTNAYVKEKAGEGPALTMVCARRQTAGRGQRGNSWESEPGRNLTFSFYIDDLDVAPAGQFVVSEAVALAMAASLAGFGIEAKVKWPNDIYVADRKICGILIENSIMGSRIARSVVGIGLNVNQSEFRSDAPNPVSMLQLAGHEFDLEEVARRVGENLEHYLSLLPDAPALHNEYFGRLWRADGKPHAFLEAATGRVFDAVISGVAPSGHLLLQPLDFPTPLAFAFKQLLWL